MDLSAALLGVKGLFPHIGVAQSRREGLWDWTDLLPGDLGGW